VAVKRGGAWATQPPGKEGSEMELGGLKPGRKRPWTTPNRLSRSRWCQAIPEASRAWPEGIAGRERESAQHREADEQNAVVELEGEVIVERRQVAVAGADERVHRDCEDLHFPASD